VDETEAAVEREFTSLMRFILARYHEEQVWSDKIRSASTYGSLAALGLNMLVFILAIVIVEPWKRRRLAQTFEKKIEEMSLESKERMEESLKEIGEKFVQQENLLSEVLQDVSRLTELRRDVVGVQKAFKEAQAQVVEVPIPVEKYVSIPGVPVSLPQRTFELAAVGVGAFVFGVIASVLAD
jgi:sensitive to high expression protein 9